MGGGESQTRLDEMLRHFDLQRTHALALIQRHNQLLATLLHASERTAAPVQPATAPELPAGHTPRRGSVVSLFDYARSTPTPPAAVPDNQIFGENDAQARARWGRAVDDLLARFGADDALAINRKYLAGTLFLTAARDALFYFRSQSGVMFVVCYVGPDHLYAGALEELKHYAGAQSLQINLMAHEPRVEALRDAGFSTTPMGIWQRIQPVVDFTIEGSTMRRLRYLVGKYAKTGSCRTLEYVPGTDADTDAAICRVIDEWVVLKGQTPPFTVDVKSQVRTGGFGADHRFFLTWRDQALDNVIVFSRDNLNDGYLMDLEFYGADMPLGGTEFALSEIITLFKTEKRGVVSLGLTMATGLFEHENGSKDVHTLFEQLRKANYLNGDANAQYKNKYRPITTTMYLARPKDAGKRKLNDLMLLLGSSN